MCCSKFLKHLGIILLVIYIGLFSYIFANYISIVPYYEDMTSHKDSILYAGCDEVIQVRFQNISWVIGVDLNIWYDYDKLQLNRLIPSLENKADIFDYKIEYNNIHFSKKITNATLQDMNLFKIELKTDTKTTWSILSILSWSYIIVLWNKKIPIQEKIKLSFSPTDDCTPDFTAPTVSLLYPQNTKDPLPLDAYFVLEIKDNESWVDTWSVKILFNGEIHGSWECCEHMIRSWNTLAFYPEHWIPIDKNLDLKIIIQDLQIHDGPNITEDKFLFKSASWVMFTKYVELSKFREFIKRTDMSERPTKIRCEIIHESYIKGSDKLRQKFRYMADNTNKISWCPIPSDEEVSAYVYLVDYFSIIRNTENNKRMTPFSKFMILFSCLLAIVFISKFYVFVKRCKAHARELEDLTAQEK